MSSCGVALMSAGSASYKMPGSSYHTHYSSTPLNYRSSYDTSWKNYGSSSTRPFVSRTSSCTDYKPRYSSASRTSSVPLSIQAGLLSHNLGTKLSYPVTLARDIRERSTSLSANSSSKLLKNDNTLEPALNGYMKYLGSRHSNVTNLTSVGDVTKYSSKFRKYSLNTLPLTGNTGNTTLRSVSSSVSELEIPTARRTSGSYTSSPSRFTKRDSLSDYYDKNPSLSSANYTSRLGVDAKASALSSVGSRNTIHSSSPFNEDKNIIRKVGQSTTKKQETGLIGLENIGNTCFLNSVVQCLSNTNPLLDYILKNEYSSEINTESRMRGGLLREFCEVIKKLWQEDSRQHGINPTAFKTQIHRFASRFIGNNQQDAQEFLRYLLEGLHEDLNRVKFKSANDVYDAQKMSSEELSARSWKSYLRRDNSKIVDIFVGQLKSTLTCTSCGNSSITFDPFWDLSLPIPDRVGGVDITQCLDFFTSEDILDGGERPECSVCKGRQRSTKRFSIQKFPKILVLHIKRFSSLQEGSWRGKLNVKVDFPINDLSLREYASYNSANCIYNLFGVVNHTGTTRSGHYVSFCKHPHSGNWHEYNDIRVSPLTTSRIVTSDAYLLFYEMKQRRL